ncbi:hypothetical protein RB620_23455 [Paenibacillus sp. LHD-117]|uniref:hypothetical protein n=1 Tax=Paenibacillus sp. LHD-117 TaxID=3071412 RepID=UPI0027E14BD5|nr:hypothetical protein [Paenibacillus sp. LHD-117]MDQ6422392.1 hypothetical protein [Paenibacillus sp. LHD-117]
MNLQKRIIIRFPILMLLAVTILASCGGNNMRPEKALNSFSKLIENKNLDDLSLTIYYISPSILTRAPLSVDGLINSSHVHKEVANGSSLEEHIDLLNQLSNDVLIPVENKSRIDARFYYVFETKKNRKIFDVSMWGNDNSIFVNGLEVQEDDIFYDVVMPLLSEDGVKALETYLNREKQE